MLDFSIVLFSRNTKKIIATKLDSVILYVKRGQRYKFPKVLVTIITRVLSSAWQDCLNNGYLRKVIFRQYRKYFIPNKTHRI